MKLISIARNFTPYLVTSTDFDDTYVLRTLYYAFVRSRIEYARVV